MVYCTQSVGRRDKTGGETVWATIVGIEASDLSSEIAFISSTRVPLTKYAVPLWVVQCRVIVGCTVPCHCGLYSAVSLGVVQCRVIGGCTVP